MTSPNTGPPAGSYGSYLGNTPALRSPARRRLRTFAFDPMTTRLSSRYLVVDVRFEKNLAPGPSGALVQVVDRDAARDCWYRAVDLDDPAALAADGLQPSESDPRSHQQVVYAVAMAVIERFEQFLGRRFRWRSDDVLVLVPHAFEGRNAFFDPRRSAVLFGYYRADVDDPGANLPGQMMFTCLSSDVVAHEVTHALLHRVRRDFDIPTNDDVFAWHEAFADLVALFQHFAYADIVRRALADADGDIARGAGLLDLAQEFGASTGRGAALRSAIQDGDPTPARFNAATEPHERGACFVAAVFDAFRDVYRTRTSDLLRIATGGTGVLPRGSLHPDLVGRLADDAVATADQLLGIVVRALDYLPVVDPTFGDVVRAIVTADRDLYPEDPGRLRMTLVEALRRRGIYPDEVLSLAEGNLSWPGPATPLRIGDDRHVDLAPLILSATQDLDLSGAAGDSPWLEATADGASEPRDADPEDVAQSALGGLAVALMRWAEANAATLGLEPDQRISLRGMHATFQRGSDHHLQPHIVLQFCQERPDLADPVLLPTVRAGTTVIASTSGWVRYVIAKPLPAPAGTDAPAAGSGGRPQPDYGPAGRTGAAKRLRSRQDWAAGVMAGDPTSPWTPQPAVERLTFANLHGRST